MDLMNPLVLSATAFQLCRQIAYNRKYIVADTFEGRLSRNATLLQTQIKEDMVIATADALIDEASAKGV